MVDDIKWHTKTCFALCISLPVNKLFLKTLGKAELFFRSVIRMLGEKKMVGESYTGGKNEKMEISPP
jgi:hypothetical protein